jgi:hypothetical protein
MLSAIAQRIGSLTVAGRGRRVFCLVVAASMLLAIWLDSIASNLKTAAPSIKAPWQEVQAASTPAEFGNLLSQWDGTHRERLRFGVYLDCVFPALYATVLIGLTLWAGHDTISQLSNLAPIAALLVVLSIAFAGAGACFDWLENWKTLTCLKQYNQHQLASEFDTALMARWAHWKWVCLKMAVLGIGILSCLAWVRVLRVLRLCCWMWLLRVPVLITFLVFILPALAEGMTKGAFDSHGSTLNLAWLGLVLGLLIFSIWRTVGIIIWFGDERANVPDFLRLPHGSEHRFKTTALLAACTAILPAVAKVLELSVENERPWMPALFAITLGVIVALAFATAGLKILDTVTLDFDRLMVIKVQELDRASTKPKRWSDRAGTRLLKVFQKASPRIWEGYFSFTPAGTFLEPEQIRSGFFAFLSVAVFGVFAILPPQDVPAFLYVALLLMAVCWLLASLSFFADRFRIPIVLPIVLWISAGTLLRSEGSVFPARSWPTNSIRSTPHHILAERQTQTPVVVAVCGGGIHSGTWGAYVLTELDQYLASKQQSLSKNVVCVSGVSGGSYGLMHYVSAYDTNGSISACALSPIRQRTRTSSLGATIHGLVCRDLPQGFLPTSGRKNRGGAMEEAWLKSFDQTNPPPAQYLSAWAEDTAAGRKPAILFGATSVESGRAVVFGTSLPWTNADPVLTAMDLDVPVVTAARMSATFPFISPVARPAVTNAGITHVGDGGYYDNYGVVSLVRWLDDALDPTYGPTNLLVILVRYERDTNAPSKDLQRGALFQMNAPFSTLLNVRTAAQQSNADLLLDMLASKWKGRINIKRAHFEYRGPAALSWHLTQTDIRNLERQASEISTPGTVNNDAAKLVEHFLGQR